MLKLIADSGSTKTDWTLLDEEGKLMVSCHSQGLNPYHLSDEEISHVLQNEVKPFLLAALNRSDVLEKNFERRMAVYFYGSGVTDAMIPRMEKLLGDNFDGAEAHAASDMLGAARALLGHEQGIAVILGTGSNSCFYDGEKMIKGVSPLGYILGDEGSGTAIGKAFFRLIFRNPEAAALKEKFMEWSGMDYAAVIDRVYRQPLANTYLASVATFVGEQLTRLKQTSSENQADFLLLSEMVKQVYADFCQQVLKYYSQSTSVASSSLAISVGFVGSIAYYFQDFISKALREHGFAMGKIMKSPMEGLVLYHSNKGICHQ